MVEDLLANTYSKGEGRPVQALDLASYEPGDVIFKEGDESSCFYVILSGQVGLSRKNKRVRILEHHDVFGLETIILRRPLPYSARAISNTRIARYGAEALDHCIRENPQMVRGILKSALQQLLQTSIYLTRDADSFTLGELRVEFFSDGEVIVEEGSSGNDFFRLVSTEGGLLVTKGGKEVNRIEKPGEFFGEMAGLLALPRQATITSIGQSVIERFSFEDMEVIIRDYPEVALQILRTMVKRLMELSRKYSEVLD